MFESIHVTDLVDVRVCVRVYVHACVRARVYIYIYVHIYVHTLARTALHGTKRQLLQTMKSLKTHIP